MERRFQTTEPLRSGQATPTAAYPPATRKLTVRANIGWAFVGSALQAGGQWGTFVLLAKLATPFEVGQFALATALATPIFLFANLQLRVVYVTDAAHRVSFPTVISLRFLTNLIAFIALLALSIHKEDPESLGAIILFVALSDVFQSTGDIIHAYFQKIERQDLIALSSAAKGALSLLLTCGTYAVTKDLALAAAGYSASRIIPLLCVDLPRLWRHYRRSRNGRDIIRPRLPKNEVRLLLKSAVPLAGAIAISGLIPTIPRLALESHHGLEHLGIFAALSQLMAAGNILIQSASQALSPRLSRLYLEQDLREFRRLTSKMVNYAIVASLLAVAAIALAGDELVSFLYSDLYAEHQGAFVVIALAAGSSLVAQALNSALTASGFHVGQLPLQVVLALICLLASHLLVPQLGIFGAALAVLVSNTSHLAVAIILIIRRTRISAPEAHA